ncbi:hypothetical protein [Prosthecobacter sp.]|uniref:hypothetical protein n=1 Tax=Prosthecobacter sp. TaxID=1965333 RepID=UPI0037842DB3
MKIKALILTLAMPLFAGMASAQSDPSVGGSFGTAFKENTGNVVQRQPISATASTTMPMRTSFWGRLTGKRDTSAQAVTATPSGRAHSWFHRHSGTDYQPASSRSWFGMHRSTHAQPTAPVSSRYRMNNNTAATKHRNWHIPFFSSRQRAHT